MTVVRSHPRPAELARLVPPPATLRTVWEAAWPLLFWALWGAWLVASDLRSGAHVQGSVVRLLAGGLVLGFARPRRWWLWALAVAAWVPAEAYIANLLRATPADLWSLGGWLLAPIPALAGGLLGRGIAMGVRPPASR